MSNNSTLSNYMPALQDLDKLLSQLSRELRGTRRTIERHPVETALATAVGAGLIAAAFYAIFRSK